MKTTVLIAALVAAPLTSSAQDVNVAALADETNIVTVKTGAEYGLVFDVGYARVKTFVDRPVVVGADVALDWGGLDIHDYRVSAGALAPLVGGSRWKVVGALAASVRGTDNDLGRFTSIGGDVAIRAGRYAARGFIVAELGLDTALATHVTHGDTYRMTVFADAKDGWYGATSCMVRIGLQGGVTIGRHDLILSAGRLVDTAGQPALLPIYGTLTFGTRW